MRFRLEQGSTLVARRDFSDGEGTAVGQVAPLIGGDWSTNRMAAAVWAMKAARAIGDRTAIEAAEWDAALPKVMVMPRRRASVEQMRADRLQRAPPA